MADLETVPALLAARRADAADVRAIVADDATLTYAELDDASFALAGRLVAAGVVKGDRVALLALNSAEWAVIAWGVMRIGAVLVPLSTLLRPAELASQIRTAGVSHLIAAAEVRGRRHLDELDSVAGGYRDLVAGGGRHPEVPSLRRAWTTDGVPDAPAPVEVVQAMGDRVRPADDMVVLFTSGSTGGPKGTIHTHGGALRATASGLAVRGVGPGDRLYIPMPLFWTGGFSSGLVTTALAGATLLTEAVPEPFETLKMLERERATLFRGWPDQAAALAAHPAFEGTDLSSLGDASLGALLPVERRPPPGARPNLFGMTETFGPWCADAMDRDMPRERWGSCGRPIGHLEVRIVDPESGDALPVGAEGEIWLRGSTLLRGVCGRSRSEVFTPDGWFRTGDRAAFDDAGYLWYRGRLDDMFKVKGATVYPSEVEAALRSLPVVRQAHVTSVLDDRGAPQVGAAVISDQPEAVVRTAARQQLSAFKIPTRWLVTHDPADVPTTATGKVDKRALSALLSKEEP